MDNVFGIDPAAKPPIIPPAPPPPTVDAAANREVVGDRLKVRKGRAATDLSSGSAAPVGAVGVYKALGGV